MAGRPKEFDEREALAAATDLFWSRGYEASSISRLIDEMGINRQSAYGTFGDKRELFMKALHAYADKVVSEIGALLQSSPSPLQCVRNFLHGMSKLTAEGDGRGCLLTNTIIELGPHDAEVRNFISSIHQRLEDALADLMARAIEVGELSRGKDPRGLARFVVMVMQGALVQSKTNRSGSIADAIRVAESVLQ